MELTIHDRTTALVSDKRVHVDRLRNATAKLQAELFGAFPEPTDNDGPTGAHPNTVEGDLAWLMDLNQDTRNALDVLDGIVSKIAATFTESRATPSPRDTYPPAVARRG